jgi:hypothetical protein
VVAVIVILWVIMVTVFIMGREGNLTERMLTLYMKPCNRIDNPSTQERKSMERMQTLNVKSCNRVDNRPTPFRPESLRKLSLPYLLYGSKRVLYPANVCIRGACLAF